MPPMMPILGLSVLGANSFPLGTEITILIPFFFKSSFATSSRFSFIIFFGVGLIAGLLISSPNPGFVTTPTPSPPSISIDPELSVNDKSTTISAP